MGTCYSPEFKDESEDIFIGEKATIYTSAQIIGLAYIGKSTKIGA